MAQGAEIEPVEDLEHLEQHGPLAPEPARPDLVPLERRVLRRLDPDPEVGEVLPGQEAALLPVIADDRLRDVAPVEGLPRRVEPGCPARSSRRAVLVRQVGEGRGEIGLDQPLTDLEGPAPGEKDGRRGRPAAVCRFVLADDLGHEGAEREAVPRQLDGRGGDLREPQGPVTLEGGDPGVGGGRHDRPEQALGNLAAAPGLEQLDGRRARP